MFRHRAAVHPRLVRLFGQARVKRQVEVAKSRLVGRGQLAGRVVADGLQEPISRGAVDTRFDLEHRLVCQPLEAVGYIARNEMPFAANLLDCIGSYRPCKYREPLQQRSLRWIEQLIAPVDGRAKRAVARVGVAWPAGQKA